MSVLKLNQGFIPERKQPNEGKWRESPCCLKARIAAQLSAVVDEESSRYIQGQAWLQSEGEHV